MDWNAAEKREDGTTPQGRMFEAVRRLESLRAGHAAFSADADVRLMPPTDDSLLGVERSLGGERLIALFNFSEWPKAAQLGGGGSFIDLWTGNPVRAEGLTVPAGGFLWLLDMQ
jgi:amylosucrase